MMSPLVHVCNGLASPADAAAVSALSLLGGEHVACSTPLHYTVQRGQRRGSVSKETAFLTV